jgi:hypothetical protein
MKKIILTSMIGILFILTLFINFVNAEMYSTQNVIIDRDSSTVTLRAFYRFDDTSDYAIGSFKQIRMDFDYYVDSMPHNYTDSNNHSYIVNSCNLTYYHFKNNYTFTQNAVALLTGTYQANDTMEFSSSAYDEGTFILYALSRDTMQVDFICYYNDSNYLYADNFLAGSFDSFIPAFACLGCQDKSLENIMISNQMNINQETIYDQFQTVIGWNFQIWLIIDWIVKIVFIIASIGLIFTGVYFIYIFLKGLGDKI